MVIDGLVILLFFFQAEDGIRDVAVTGVQTCALPIYKLRFAMNAFVISRDTEEEAVAVLRDIIGRANVEAVKGFGESVKEAGQSSPEGEGMWSNSSFEDLVQYNDGFKPRLIGTPEQIAWRIQQYEAVGVDILLTGFLDYIQEVQDFGWRVGPLVRNLPSLRAQQELSTVVSGTASN